MWAFVYGGNMVSAEFLRKLPEKPGIYIMKNKNDKVIYVGKAKVLKNRVKQYFTNSKSHTAKVEAMVKNIDHMEYIVTGTEAEALNLECSLIKKYRPRYNILLKDDKTYPYIKITNEKYPRIILTRRVEDDGAKYFGPYVNMLAVKTLIETLRKTFKFRDCKSVESRRGKPCLNYHIKRCIGPCIDEKCEFEYNRNIKDATDILNGNFKTLITKLENEMLSESEKLRFESAAAYRDKITAVKKMEQRQIAVRNNDDDEDYIAIVRESGYVCIQVLSVRRGNLIGKDTNFMNNCGDEKDSTVLTAFIKQYYMNMFVPRYIYVSENLDEEIEEDLSELKGKKVKIRKPVIGEKNSFINMARENGKEAIMNLCLYEKKRYTNEEALKQLEFYLGLECNPQRIEAYDISNTAGKLTVASMIVYTNGVPDKSEYRKFKINFSEKTNDYGSMREVMYRRFKRALSNDDKFSKLPDVIFVDGGKGQISAAESVIGELGIKVKIFGIVKDEKHRTRAVVSKNEEYDIPQGTKCFKMIVSIQDEMHRMAITYHKNLRNKKITESELIKIPGVGKKTYDLLMKEFKTIDNIKRASWAELSAIKGINKVTAHNIENSYKK